MNLGMNVIVLDVNQGAWKLETERGVIMDGNASLYQHKAADAETKFAGRREKQPLGRRPQGLKSMKASVATTKPLGLQRSLPGTTSVLGR